MQNKGIVYQNEVPDREAYILEFEKKLQSGAKSDEVLTAENANAFMFDLLNFDFCNINGDGPDKTYETSTYTLNVSNGTIDLDEFANLYSQISSHVYDYYHSLSFDNKNYYCIVPEIAEFDANATTTTVTVKSTLTSGLAYRNFTYDSTLCEYFTQDEYQWQEAAEVLQNCFNSEYPRCSLGSGERCYFTTWRDMEFYYLDYYFSWVPFRSRLYYCGRCDFDDTYISKEEMCKLLNDYIDLAQEYSHGSCVMGCTVTPVIGNREQYDAVPIHHLLIVNYAEIVCSTFQPRL